MRLYFVCHFAQTCIAHLYGVVQLFNNCFNVVIDFPVAEDLNVVNLTQVEESVNTFPAFVVVVVASVEDLRESQVGCRVGQVVQSCLKIFVDLGPQLRLVLFPVN